jgi:hypothetical protein
MARGTTKPPAKKKTPKLLKELETDLNPESTNPSNNKQQSVKISASQVWLGSYVSSHLISSYIYVAYGHILAGTIKTINHISTGYELAFRRDYN